jgi:hypothetical protein
MAVTRIKATVLGIAAAIAVAMPLWLLQPGSGLASAPVEPPPLVMPPAPPPLTAVFTRALFGGAPTAESDAPLPADAPQLVGIVGRIGSDAVAMVRSGEGSSRTLKLGESVDGWTLESLAIDAAFFTRGGQRLRVPLPVDQ